MHQNHALFGLDPAVVHMAIKAPEHAPADLKARIALAVKRAKEGRTFEPPPVPRLAAPSVPPKPIFENYSVPKSNISYGFSYSLDRKRAHERKTLTEIMQEVAEKYGVSTDDIKSHRRTSAIIVPRHEFYYRARSETPRSYPEIGRFCGGRDHTTILSGVRKHAKINGISLPEFGGEA